MSVIDAAGMIATAAAGMLTTVTIITGRPADFRSGDRGRGALIVVDDAAGIGPDGFDTETIGILDRSHGIFVLADPSEEAVSALLATATGSIVGIVLTDAAHADTWRDAIAVAAPGVIMMTSIGAAVPATVAVVGAA